MLSLYLYKFTTWIIGGLFKKIILQSLLWFLNWDTDSKYYTKQIIMLGFRMKKRERTQFFQFHLFNFVFLQQSILAKTIFLRVVESIQEIMFNFLQSTNRCYVIMWYILDCRGTYSRLLWCRCTDPCILEFGFPLLSASIQPRSALPKCTVH